MCGGRCEAVKDRGCEGGREKTRPSVGSTEHRTSRGDIQIGVTNVRWNREKSGEGKN